MAVSQVDSRASAPGSARVMEPRRVAAPAPVVWWAGAGAAMLAFMLFVGIRWVTGPFFKVIPAGQSDPPTWMKISMITFAVAGCVLTAGVVYRLIIRRWRLEHRVTSDGLLVIAFFTMWFQDPMSNYGGYWFLYNSWQPNIGSWANDIPGWMAPGTPGHNFSEPLVNGFDYVYFMIFGMFIGLWIMRKARARFPRYGLPMAILLTYVGMSLFDFAVEVGFWQDLGIYSYTSSPGPMVFHGNYRQFPISESIMVGVMVLAMVLLRYFTDDRGYTIVERGVDRVNTTPGKKVALRLLAMIAGVQILYFFSFTLWTSYWGFQSKDWPKQVVTLSYFNNGICGSGTTRLCPDGRTPISNGPASGWIGLGGRIVYPGEKNAPVIPFPGTPKPKLFQW